MKSNILRIKSALWHDQSIPILGVYWKELKARTHFWKFLLTSRKLEGILNSYVLITLLPLMLTSYMTGTSYSYWNQEFYIDSDLLANLSVLLRCWVCPLVPFLSSPGCSLASHTAFSCLLQFSVPHVSLSFMVMTL